MLSSSIFAESFVACEPTNMLFSENYKLQEKSFPLEINSFLRSKRAMRQELMTLDSFGTAAVDLDGGSRELSNASGSTLSYLFF